MGTIANKLTYLNTTKTMLRDSLNKFGSNILTTDTFRSYDTKLNDIYNKLPKITQSGAGLTITPVQNGQVDDFKMIGTDLYQNQLPSEYTAVEYLQSDNECYIDTGINADYKLSLKIKIACLNSTQQHMGAINNTGSSYIRHHITFNPSQAQDIGIYIGQTNSQLSLKSFDNNFHEFNLDIYNKKVSIDNDSPISISYNNFDVGINYYLFARNGSNIAISKGSYKIAYCKMYYEDNLVRDFAPCYRNSDNVTGLYDFVTNTFFTNQGTGTFTVGNTITLPNPDYPQEIKVVEGRQVITDKGKNLFDKNNANILTGFLADNGTFNATTGYKTLYISCNNFSTYTIQKTSGSFFRVAEFENIPANGDNWITRTKDDNANVITFTTTTGNYLAVTYFRATGTITEQEMLKSIQIEENSSATDYEPYYNPVSYNIDLHGKNYFDGQYEDGYYNNSNGKKNTTQDPYGCRSTNKNEVKPNENYIISVNNVVTNLSIRLFYYDINRNFLSTDTTTTGIFTTPNDCYFIAWHSSALKQNYPDGIPNMMIENNSQVTSYEGYYNYKLAKMPNTTYKNRIYKNNGNWYYEKNVEKVILDGSETWIANYSGTTTYRYVLTVSDSITTTNQSTDVYCKSNYFAGESAVNAIQNNATKNMTAIISSNRLIITTIDNSLFGLNTFKEWLATHNLEVWYILATPVTTQITNTTLISQLEAISVHTGTNIITISNSNNIIPEIEITRLKELEKLA